MLRLVPPSPATFGPAWHARSGNPPEVAPARCCWCGRDIAVRAAAVHLTAACIYCGLDRGDIPPIDVPFCEG